MRILTRQEIRQITSRTELDARTVIERAGYAVAQFCVSQFKFGSVCVVCGRGGNGAVGLMAAEALKPIANSVVVIVTAGGAGELLPDAAALVHPETTTLWIANESDFDSDAVREALGADLVIDAILGTGFRPPLSVLARKAVHAINDAPGTIVSVDVPSGVDADSRSPLGEGGGNMVFPHGIIALIAPRPAHIFGELTSGPIAVSEIGTQPVLTGHSFGLDVVTGREVRISFARRPKDVQNRLFGHVLVVAASSGKAGVAAIAAMAALNSGARLATVACPKSMQATIAGFNPALMTEALPETDQGEISAPAIDRMDRLLDGKDVVVVGPGSWRNEAPAAFLRELIARSPMPLIFSGHAVAAFEGRSGELRPHNNAARIRVFILHPDEAARLIGVSLQDIQIDLVKAARRISSETGGCVVIEGWQTIVAGTSGEAWINLSGNPALAKGGSDDALCGIIAAALASPRDDALQNESQLVEQKVRFMNDLAVAAGVHLHGLAGDIACEALHENAVMPTDLIEALSEALRSCELQADRSLFYIQR